MLSPQQKIHNLKSLVFDLEESPLKRKCDKFIKKNFNSLDLVKEETVNWKIRELRDSITTNLGFRENLTVLADTPSKPVKKSLLEILTSWKPLMKEAATLIIFFLTNKPNK